MTECHGKTEGTGDWEPVIAPFACSYYAIYGRWVDDQGNESPVKFDKCSKPGEDGSCVKKITQFSVNAMPAKEWRWNRGEVITYVRSDSPLELYFLR